MPAAHGPEETEVPSRESGQREAAALLVPKYSGYRIARTVLFWRYLHTLNTVTGNYGYILPIFDLPENRIATVRLSWP